MNPPEEKKVQSGYSAVVGGDNARQQPVEAHYVELSPGGRDPALNDVRNGEGERITCRKMQDKRKMACRMAGYSVSYRGSF